MNFALLNNKHLLLLLALASAAILGGAVVGQYFFGLHPCHLCILQRWPHALVIALGLGGVLFVQSTALQKKLIHLCCLSLLIGSGIAIYHTGVEQGWVKGPTSCTSDASADLSLEEIRAQISGAALVTCDQAMGYIFGISLAAWNALISAAMIIFAFFPLRKRT